MVKLGKAYRRQQRRRLQLEAVCSCWMQPPQQQRLTGAKLSGWTQATAATYISDVIASALPAATLGQTESRRP